ncbi:ROK family protein [Paenibacillus sp. OV219]|uniref:ROK family protein n=1 Tax=Paenibacillus sp. OV219 TaxID=1884377 RepID=UPI0008C91686|nr:ROK family protein [Paenibacillus sp. OV219]SEO05182.1 transcriptional regulator [Paenibacillus sp. OV219]
MLKRPTSKISAAAFPDHSTNLLLVKQSNLSLLFTLIQKYERISRAQLAEMTQLSPTTVSTLTDELLSKRLIRETGAGVSETRGRKPIMLEIRPDGGYVAAAEWMNDRFSLFLYDLQGNEVGGGESIIKDYTQIADLLSRRLDELVAEYGLSAAKLVGLCIGIPGLIDFEHQRVIQSTVLAIERDNNFYEQLQVRYGAMPIMLGNQSSFYAYAEQAYGAAKAYKDMIFIDSNVGIGAGFLLDGKIFTGSRGLGGEIGHMTIDRHGPRCKCGNRGCLELMAGLPAILNKLQFAILSGRATSLQPQLETNPIPAIRSAFEQGDLLVVEVLDEMARDLAFGITNVVHLINPEAVMIGGRITQLGDAFLRLLQDAVAEKLPHIPPDKLAVRYSELQEDAVTRGASRYLLDQIGSNLSVLHHVWSE